MLAKSLRRPLASIARLTKPIVYPVDRKDPNNVLNTNPVSVNADLAAQYKRYTLTNTETRIRVNRFLEAVYLNDTGEATKVLAKFREKCIVNRLADSFPRNLEVYISCLVTMVMHFCLTPSGLHTRELRSVIDTVIGIPDHVISRQAERVNLVRQLVLILALQTLQGLDKRKSAFLLLVTETRELSEKWALDETTMNQLVTSKYPDLLPQFNLVWHKRFSPPSTPKIALELNVDAFLNPDGTMSYDGLCKFLAETRFDVSPYSCDPTAKIYDVYQSLSKADKPVFMKNYMKFNKKRQLLVEQFCGDLHESLHRGDDKVVFLFGSTNSRWLQQWHSLISLGLEKARRKGGILERYSFFLSVTPIDAFVSSILSTMLAETLPRGEAKLSSLTSRLGYAFKRMIKRNKRFLPLSKELNLFLNEEDSVKFFTAVVKVILESCKIPEGVSDIDGDLVFSFGYSKFSQESPGYKKAGMIKIHPLMSRQFETCLELLLTNSYLLPMVHPPKPWISPNVGGFLENSVPLVKSTDKEATSYFMNMAHRTGQLNSIYDSLNALGSVPWAIEPNVLKTFNEAMSYDEGFLHLPPKLTNINFKEPKKPQKHDFTADDEYNKAFSRYRSEKELLRKKNNENHSLRVYYELANKLANSLGKNGDAVYYPQNLDFRGRVYPCTSFLSNHNEDLMRALLTFWEAKPLGPNGYAWLSYQLANVFLGSSISMEELRAFVEKNRTAITESATSPLGKGDWWKKGDSPWQTLALCMEFRKVWEFDGNIEDYNSRIPVHMDGTCNGLQHYAALGADTEAASSVNLMPSDVKRDVYVTVLDRVRQKVQNDFDSEEEGVSTVAKQVHHLLSRKVVKQTVMTTVYGVTLYGAFKQIREKLDEALGDTSDGNYNPETAKMATYTAKYVLEAISDLFSGAKIIQSWLLENCGRCISAYEKHSLPQREVDFFSKKRFRPMMWTSLSGLPIIQPYRKNTTKEISTVLQKVSVQHIGKITHIDYRKQLNGIAPNFIHLLDAMHLLMTCLASKEAKISFVAVHDSFWTHPGDVEVLNKVIREEFVRLHKSGIIRNLRKDLEHVNRNAYQVVWVENKAEFTGKLKQLRRTYNCGSKNTFKAWNTYLNLEFRDNAAVEMLIEEYEPELLYVSGGEAIVYSTLSEDRKKKKVSKKTHTPLLVPVKILEEPKLGDLDIERVLASKYFFS